MHKFRTVRRREAIKRFDLAFPNTGTTRLWDGPKNAKEVLVVLLDVGSSAAEAESDWNDSTSVLQQSRYHEVRVDGRMPWMMLSR